MPLPLCPMHFHRPNLSYCAKLFTSQMPNFCFWFLDHLGPSANCCRPFHIRLDSPRPLSLSSFDAICWCSCSLCLLAWSNQSLRKIQHLTSFDAYLLANQSWTLSLRSKESDCRLALPLNYQCSLQTESVLCFVYVSLSLVRVFVTNLYTFGLLSENLTLLMPLSFGKHRFFANCLNYGTLQKVFQGTTVYVAL